MKPTRPSKWFVALQLAAWCTVALPTPITNQTCIHDNEASLPTPALINQYEEVDYLLGEEEDYAQPDGTNTTTEGELLFLGGKVPRYLQSTTPATFYRAVIGEELEFLEQNYPLNKSPPRHSTQGGDFTVGGVGGMYVFDLDIEAEVYGRCHSRVKRYNHFYIVTFQYKRNTKLSTTSFPNDNERWRTFVDNCYKNKRHGYAAVEGPYSMMNNGKKVGAPQQGGGKGMLWQAAFIGQNALRTLTVTKLRKVLTNAPKFPSCTLL